MPFFAQDHEGLVKAINDHRAYHHVVFAVLERAKPPDDKLVLWLSHMAQFCHMARQVHSMPDNLRLYATHRALGDLIESIKKNEAENGKLYDRMAARLTGRKVLPSARLTPALEAMNEVFMHRDYDDIASVNYSLGAYLALDVMTDHHIIPGQLRAFVRSGHYGVSLGDPDIEYLNKHLREFENVSRHEKKLEQAGQIVTDTPESYTYVNKGLQDFMDGLLMLYGELTAIVHA